jgi:hypothetical protein
MIIACEKLSKKFELTGLLDVINGLFEGFAHGEAPSKFEELLALL